MRATRTCLLATLVAACGGSSSKDVDAMVMVMPDAPPDAPPDAFEPTFDFSCIGNTQGAAAANVTLAGNALEVTVNQQLQPQIGPAHNATVDVCKASTTACSGTGSNPDRLDQQMTPASGCPNTGCAFTSASLATMGSPLDIFVKVSKTGDRTSYIYPPAPLIADATNIPGVMFSTGLITLLGAVGINQEAGKGNMLLALTDCSNMPITDTVNVTLSIKQGGNDVSGTMVVDASMFAAQLAGTFAVFNVPVAGTAQNPLPAVTEVGAKYKDKVLRAHLVKVFPDATTATVIRPGF